MTEADELRLWLGAVRYYLGRESIAVSGFSDMLIRHWIGLGDNARRIIRRDVEEAFRSDDDARKAGIEYRPLGAECDRQSWERVRLLWRAESPEP